MQKGKRYEEPKLNMKKVFGVIFVFVLIIIIIISMIKAMHNEPKTITKERYFVAYKDSKFGVINQDGNIVIDCKYDEMITIPNNRFPIFIYTYDIDDSNGTYKSKAINDKENPVFDIYEKVEAIDNFDSKHKTWYEDNVLKVSNYDKYGLIDFQGQVLLRM